MPGTPDRRLPGSTCRQCLHYLGQQLRIKAGRYLNECFPNLDFNNTGRNFWSAHLYLQPLCLFLRLHVGLLELAEPIGPVSYTHLDVYKRQLLGSLTQSAFQVRAYSGHAQVTR